VRKSSAAAGVVAGLTLAAVLAAPAQAISATTADLSVLHAIPDTPVDVYVNGELTLDDFAPGTLAGPLDLAAGSYAIAITAPDAADASAPILEASVDLAAGASYTAVAHLTEAGEPTVTPFRNDLTATAAGQGRLTVRHVAAAPAVDILAGGVPAIEGLTNPNEATANLPVGTVSAAVALAGTTEPVIGPTDVAIQDGVLTIVYAWGSATDGNLALAVQTVTVGHTSPDGVISGTAGYAAQRDGAGWWVAMAFAAVAASVTALVGLRLRAAKLER
jgi:hypothetical protein